MFKIRASAAGKLMTNPTGKSNLEKYNEACDKLVSLELKYEAFANKQCKTALKTLNEDIPNCKKLISELELIKDKKEISQTAKTFVQNYLKEQIYKVSQEIKSKYLSKGLTLEDEAIDCAITWLDLPFVLKNEETFEDEYFKGTPDLILNDEVLDIKNSWDCFTFPLFEYEIPTSDYYYQLQVYMHLTGTKKARLVYVLLNTPDELTWETKNDYSNIDTKYRIKEFFVQYDESVIEDLKNRVINVRQYIETIKK